MVEADVVLLNNSKMPFKAKNIIVVVLGDIGRSPRMQYHSLSIADAGHEVQLLGYEGSRPMEKLTSHSNIRIRSLLSCPEFKHYVPTVVAYMLKVIWQCLTLFMALLLSGLPSHILVQNPPSVPVLGVCYIYCKIVRAQFIIDWHNYGHSILAMSLKPHFLVQISKWFEFFFGSLSDKNICVTQAMKEDLIQTHGINAVVFYDRPPDIFKAISPKEVHAICLKLGFEYDIFLKNSTGRDTILTNHDDSGGIVLKSNRPGVVVSSTSWTEDEDFSILLDALCEYEKACEENKDLPNLICAITGKGPLKEFYMEIIKKKHWNHVDIITPWLHAEDYPVFLACADLGVSLHTSSSGLDLPMKVVDMFGCHVPVCAITFNCISELVKHNQNGFVFADSHQLSQQLQAWFTKFPSSRHKHYETFQRNLTEFTTSRWNEAWSLHVLPLFSD